MSHSKQRKTEPVHTMVLFTQSLTQPILNPASWLAATPHLERGGELPGRVFRLSATAHGEASRGERERGDVAARQVRQEAARQHERARLHHELPTWGATVRGTYRTPEAGTRTQYVLYVGPWGQAALRLRYVHNAGGWYA